MMLLRMLAVATYNTGTGEVICDVPPEEQDKIKNELACAAETFQRAGGVLTSDDWLAMSPHEKAAMIFAGNALRDEAAVQVARCISDPKYREALEATYGGGKAEKAQEYEKALANLKAVMDRVAKAMKEHVYVKP
jgi:hypothetical protein